MRRVGALVAGLVLAGSLTACGGGETPVAAPASVKDALTRVDAALNARDWVRARLALEDLVRRTVAARDNGALPAERADRILASAASLTTGLPRVVPSPSPSPRPTATRRAPVVSDDDKGDDDEEGKKRGKGRD